MYIMLIKARRVLELRGRRGRRGPALNYMIVIIIIVVIIMMFTVMFMNITIYIYIYIYTYTHICMYA